MYREFALEAALSARRVRIQVHRLNLAALVGASLDEVAKVSQGITTFLAHLDRLIAAGVELLDRALEADPQRVGGDEKDLAYGARDAVAVGVDVVQRRKLS